MNAQTWCRRIPLFGAAVLACNCPRAVAQEALGEAIQVDESRKARKQAIDRSLYPLKAGPVLLRFEASMAVEFDDNPNLLDEGAEEDFVFHPQLDIRSLWTINPYNALAFDLGIGYRKYIENTELDHLIIAPNSELSYDIKTGDFIINLHERVSYSQEPASDPTVSGTGDFGGVENTVGVRVDWDQNQLNTSVGYDHQNFFSTGSELSDVQERSSELLFGRVGMKLGPGFRTGLEVAGGFNDYDTDVFADNVEFSIGPYFELDVTKEIQARLSGGYVRYEFDDPVLDPSITNTVASVPNEVNDFYANLTIDQQLSRWMNHSLSLGREARAGAASELVTLWFARYSHNWSFSQYSTLGTQLFYEDGKERAGFNTERLWRAGAGLSLGVPLSRALTATAGYQFLFKESDVDGADYMQNRVGLEFRYVF